MRLRVNINLKAVTVEELVERRKVQLQCLPVVRQEPTLNSSPAER